MASFPLFPLEVWPQQIVQASVPANNNALRVEVLQKPALDFLNQPPSGATDGDLYIVGDTPADEWAAMGAGNAVIYQGGAWLEWEAFEGWIKYVNGDAYSFSGGVWDVFGGATSLPDSITAVFDGSGVALGSGLRIDVVVPYACEVVGYTILGDLTGSVSLSVHKASYADWPDTETAMATGGAGPSITTARKNQGDTSTWATTTISAGDILIFRVQSATDITRAVLTLSVNRT